MPVFPQKMKVPFTYVEIDGEIYMFPEAYVWENEADYLRELAGKELETFNF